MKISIRNKVTIAFTIFVTIGCLIWFLNYHKHSLLTQKLQIIEKKNALLNTILEARRYEKNYFLTLDVNNLKQALSYIHDAEKKLELIITKYRKFALTKNLDEVLNKLKKYDQSLSYLFTLYHKGQINLDERFIKDFPKYQREIRKIGREITYQLEEMVKEEHRYMNKLTRDSKIYHFIALAGIIVLSLFGILFLHFNVNRPLKSLEEAIQKIAVGDYTNIPSISNGDEFESLVSSLNNMIKELNRRNEQLIQTKKLASLGTLTSGVAHELNNPLNNISTSIQILLEELEDPDLDYKRELLIEAEKQIDRARDIVKALLEFSRERSFTLSQVYFKEVVENTLRLIKGEIPTNIELKVDIPDDIQGYMDSRRMQQVLLNLILNGIQAMEDGGVLEIKACKQDDKDEFCFLVRDTGKGIPEENLSKIFDPFFTTKDGTAVVSSSGYQSIVEQQGSGLGLSICHSIVEKHGGRIEVESVVGEGTTFIVHLPTKRNDEST